MLMLKGRSLICVATRDPVTDCEEMYPLESVPVFTSKGESVTVSSPGAEAAGGVGLDACANRPMGRQSAAKAPRALGARRGGRDMTVMNEVCDALRRSFVEAAADNRSRGGR